MGEGEAPHEDLRWFYWESEAPPFDIWQGSAKVASAETLDAAELICQAVNVSRGLDPVAPWRRGRAEPLPLFASSGRGGRGELAGEQAAEGGSH